MRHKNRFSKSVGATHIASRSPADDSCAGGERQLAACETERRQMSRCYVRNKDNWRTSPGHVSTIWRAWPGRVSAIWRAWLARVTADGDSIRTPLAPCQTRLTLVVDRRRRPADDRQTTGRRPADDRQTTGRRPADDRQTTGRRPADDRQTTGGRPADDRQTTGRRPADDRQTTGRRPAGPRDRCAHTHGKRERNPPWEALLCQYYVNVISIFL